MSRNFGIPSRGEPPRPELLSQMAKDVLAIIFLVVFMGSIVTICNIEFPNGLADLRGAHRVLTPGR